MISAVGKNSKARLRSDSILTFMLALGVMCLLYIIYDYAPFGNNSLACMDANIQYLDFFAYLQDVLIGKNSLTQTFSSFLGGNNIGTFSYYLASPFNLLVVFFDKADLHAFFDMLAALKMAMAAAAFCVFLHSRFREHLELGMRARIFCILLSLGYGLNQYTLAQSSNIMWLDGVYMLPLILTGVYYIVREKSGWRLSLFVGMSILFNWYTGGMNCLFSGFWICFEVVLYLCGGKCYTKDGDSVRAMMRQCCGYFVRYLVSMVVGVLLSMILFWPTVLAMQNSNKGDLAFEALKDFSFIGAVPSVIQGYALGAKSSYGSVSLFCGSLALIGVVLCFLSKGISFKTKAAFGTMLGGGTVAILLEALVHDVLPVQVCGKLLVQVFICRDIVYPVSCGIFLDKRESGGSQEEHLACRHFVGWDIDSSGLSEAFPKQGADVLYGHFCCADGGAGCGAFRQSEDRPTWKCCVCRIEHVGDIRVGLWLEIADEQLPCVRCADLSGICPQTGTAHPGYWLGEGQRDMQNLSDFHKEP